METITEIDSRVQHLIEKRKQLIKLTFDGRSQKHISKKTGIDAIKISRWINGNCSLDTEELNTLNEMLGTNF